MQLEKYSIGVGDRFGRQAEAQLKAFIMAKEAGVDVVPVWNKSFREHSIIGSTPDDVRKEADAAVKAMGWKQSYYLDADHINLKNVEGFLKPCDFFTLDVADAIAHKTNAESVRTFVEKHAGFVGKVTVPGISRLLKTTRTEVEAIAGKFLFAVKQAGEIYRQIEGVKGKGNFITEVSMDESDQPQTPLDMLFILAALGDEGIPAQTIAPKFTGRFNKGVDYVGDVKQFAVEIEEDLAVIAFARKEFGLPANLKLSVHSGSDKFSLYEPISRAIRKFDAGLHLKTAGTTWLEEIIGLAAAGGEGLKIAREICGSALSRIDELSGPYAAVIDINRTNLPSAKVLESWTGEEFASALRHDKSCPKFNPDLRQMLHVGYKVAAEMGQRYLDTIDEFKDVIGRNVTENIYERHIKRLFLSARRL
jgi:tagaturonate epimerase